MHGIGPVLYAKGVANKSCNMAVEIAHSTSRALFKSIFKKEKDLTDWLEAQIKQMGEQNYLVEQLN